MLYHKFRKSLSSGREDAILNFHETLVFAFGVRSDEGTNTVEIMVFYGMEVHNEMSAIVHLNSCALHFFSI